MVIFCAGCSDDDGLYRINGLGSQLEESGDYKLSSFSLAKTLWSLDDSVEIIRVQLLSLTDNSVREYHTIVTHKESAPVYCLRIPKTDKIPDSDYVLTASLLNGKQLETKITVSFYNEMLHSVLSSGINYSSYFDGSGTEEDPYLIANTEQFDELEYCLYKDSLTCGAGLYFKQTADFQAPAPGITEGRAYASYPFAGNYDGGGHSISIAYTGSKKESSDVCIGLFSTLLDGASIHDLTISATMTGIHSYGGAVAGTAYGSVTLTVGSINYHREL